MNEEAVIAKPSRRRRFRFSLRTLFVVVTLLAVVFSWLGWELKFIRQRNLAIASAARPRPSGDGAKSRVIIEFPTAVHRLRIPFWRTVLGDRPVYRVLIPVDASEQEMAKWQALFPEAGMGRWCEATFD